MLTLHINESAELTHGRGSLVNSLPYHIEGFVSIGAKFGIYTVLGINWTREAKIRTLDT